MKMKIFIGFIQCFCYFRMLNIPWVPNLLAFMELIEFDFLIIFGDLSCYMQLGFLEKFVYHMLIFPSIIILLLVVIIIARYKQWRPKYTNESIILYKILPLFKSIHVINLTSRTVKLVETKYLLTWLLSKGLVIEQKIKKQA